MNYIGRCDNSIPIPYPHAVKARMSGQCPKRKTNGENYAYTYFCQRWGRHYPCVCPNPYPYMTDDQLQREKAKCFRYSKGQYKKCFDCPKEDLSCPNENNESFCNRNNLELFDCSDFKISQVPHHKDPCRKRGKHWWPVIGTDCYDLPFTVSICPPSDLNEKPRIRSGVEQCLQPSNYRDLTTVYSKTYHDFFSEKSLKDLSLFRSPLAIDPRRMQPPVQNEGPDIVINPNSGPLHVKAWAKMWKRSGKKKVADTWPNFTVRQTGPIVLEPFDCSTTKCEKIRSQ